MGGVSSSSGMGDDQVDAVEQGASKPGEQRCGGRSPHAVRRPVNGSRIGGRVVVVTLTGTARAAERAMNIGNLQIVITPISATRSCPHSRAGVGALGVGTESLAHQNFANAVWCAGASR